jgi:tellurite resistance protein
MVGVVAAAAVEAVVAAELDHTWIKSKRPYLMFRKALNLLLTAALLSVASVQAKEPIRIDASSNATATTSYGQMIESLPARKRQQLQIAVLILNMDGVSSAHEVVNDPELQHPSIVRIKDRVSGMTADEVIRLSKRVGGIRVESQRR